MNAKQLIITIALLGTIAAHGAAENTPSKSVEEISVKDIIGISCNARGNYTFTTSLIKDGDDPNCSITFAYSEHPILKEPEMLANFLTKINQSIESQNNIVNPYALAEIRIKSELDHPVTPVTDSQHCALLALFIQLTDTKFTYAFTKRSHDGFRSGKLEGGSLGAIFTVAGHPLMLNTPIIDPQATADQLQSENQEEPFHVVLDLAKYRRLIAAHRKESSCMLL